MPLSDYETSDVLIWVHANAFLAWSDHEGLLRVMSVIIFSDVKNLQGYFRMGTEPGVEWEALRANWDSKCISCFHFCNRNPFHGN